MRYIKDKMIAYSEAVQTHRGYFIELMAKKHSLEDGAVKGVEQYVQSCLCDLAYKRSPATYWLPYGTRLYHLALKMAPDADKVESLHSLTHSCGEFRAELEDLYTVFVKVVQDPLWGSGMSYKATCKTKPARPVA